MRNQQNDAQKLNNIMKGEELLSEINQLQRNKILVAMTIFLPMMMLLGETASTQNIAVELVLGYAAAALVVLGYFFFREMYLLQMYGAEIEAAEKQMATTRKSKAFTLSMAKSLPYFQMRTASR